MSLVNNYLEHIQNTDESIFPMDSLHDKPKKPLGLKYPDDIETDDITDDVETDSKDTTVDK